MATTNAKPKTSKGNQDDAARQALARKQFLDEEDDAYHSAFDCEDSFDVKPFLRSNDGSLENGISIGAW